jgi:hypothetical protein
MLQLFRFKLRSIIIFLLYVLISSIVYFLPSSRSVVQHTWLCHSCTHQSAFLRCAGTQLTFREHRRVLLAVRDGLSATEVSSTPSWHYGITVSTACFTAALWAPHQGTHVTWSRLHLSQHSSHGLVDWLWRDKADVSELRPLRAYCASPGDCDVDHGMMVSTGANS